MKSKAKAAAVTAQTDVLQRRRNNLRALAAQWGGVTGLAKKLGYEGPSYLSQMVGPQHNRPISERTARHIEHTVGLPVNWLDQDHQHIAPASGNGSRPVDEPLFALVANAVQRAMVDAGITLSREKAHAVFIRVYTDAQRTGQVDEAMVRDLVQLAG